MSTSDDALGRLRALVAEIAVEDALGVLAEARAQARARARAQLSDLLTEAIVDRLLEMNLGDGAPEHEVRSSPSGADPNGETRASDVGPSMPGARTALYLYGVIAATDTAPLPSELELLAEGPVAALASRVDARDYDEDRLRANLGDMAWVERTARAHERTLDAVRRELTVIPMRMCTVYADEDGVRAMLRREADALGRALGELQGKSEWGVKVFAGPGAAGALGEEDASPTSGTAYLEQRLQERDAAERLAASVERAATEIHERLSAVAADALVLPGGRPRRDDPGDLALSGVYLVADEELAGFDAVVGELNAEFGPRGLTLARTGPWPAYNFVPGTLGAAW